MRHKRGYFGIGVLNIKNGLNLGTLWRSAYIFEADFIFTIGHRYKRQPSDVLKTWRTIPLLQYRDFEDWKNHLPYDCIPILVEQNEKAHNLSGFTHPKRAIYLLGAEDYGIPKKYLRGYPVIQVDSPRHYCLNVATAGSLIMYDRHNKDIKHR